MIEEVEGDLLSRIRNIDYEKKMNPIYIESMEANQIYINECAKQNCNPVEYKIKSKWVEFKGIVIRKAVLNDSLFLRYMKNKITRNSGDTCNDFIVLKFNYDADYKINGVEEKVSKDDLRTLYYKEGVTYTFEKKNKKGEVVGTKEIKFKMLMRSTGKAKNGECVFIRETLHHKAINFLTMGLYDLMDKQSQNDPEKVFKLVELSAYQTLTTATAVGYIHIPLENILIIKDEEVYSDEMRAAIVSLKDTTKYEEEFVVDFESESLEKIINKKGYTLDEEKVGEKYTLIPARTKNTLKECGFRINGKYPGEKKLIEYKNKECDVDFSDNEKIKNILWDGMGLIDESIFPKDKNGFIYCRSHFFKSCLFRGNIQDFFKDYCNDHEDLDYKTYTLEKVDMFSRNLKLSDIKVVITDKSIKWTKFFDMMGGTQKKAYRYYRRYMKIFDDCFSIVKTAHSSKWNDLQLMTYQMNNSLPTTDREVLGRITKCAVNYLNELKTSDNAYLKYLDMTKDNFNSNELLLELVRWNPEFVKTEFFREKKSKDISRLKRNFCQGRLPQYGDNLTIIDNPIALLMKVVGENPLEEGCFKVLKDGVQCYTSRFSDGDRLAAFRSPHNSPNNIIHLYNVYPDKLLRYFPNIGNNVIVFNAIKTDTQARLSGHDVDSDFVYVTNQPDLADLARKSYTEYPTIINKIDETGTSSYHFTLEDYAKMDNQIADTQMAIGTSTDIAQLALSYYYDGNMENKELEKCFIVLSVIGQISIDLAKKTFDIDVVKEINRIRHLPCIKGKDIPLFFADTKKCRNNKKFDSDKVRSMNCPMDIMADIIEENVIKYADREYHIPLRDLWNHDVIGKGNKFKREKVISAADEYNKTDKYLESQKDKFDDKTFLTLRNHAMSRFLNRASKNLNQETVMQLVIYAVKDENSDVCTTILNFLFREHKDKFMNCFQKMYQNKEKSCTKPTKTA